MPSKGFLKSGEFARMCKTTKDTLIHYDRIGLLHPAKVSAAGYRLYSYDDYYRFVAIDVLVDSGMALHDVARALSAEGPADLIPSLRENAERLHGRVEDLKRKERVMADLLQQAESAAQADSGTVEFSIMPERSVVTLCEGEAMDDDAQVIATMEDELDRLIGEFPQVPEVILAPYGMTADDRRRQEDVPAYDSMFLVMPAACGGEGFEHIPAGRYAFLTFDGIEAEVGRAHRELAEFLLQNGIGWTGPFYEISSFWLLEGEGGRSYRCTVSAKVEAT